MDQNYIIRSYQAGDEAFLSEAHERIYRDEFNWGGNFLKYTLEVIQKCCEEAEAGKAKVWIVEADGNSVGSIVLRETSDEGVGQLRLFLLEKEYRNRGIGNALLDGAMEAAKEWGFRHLFLWTAEPLQVARRKYARLGFAITGRELMTDWALDGSEVYEELWEIDLG